ncbi:hypothetical protein PMAYCL1PPCAC_22981 [Pristionchus mayeri]|uniref:Uncharacterized protein n=1 Tax=Pristionchus mayeri TaxID=1317129 RepID=A0AAN5I703_9BILA|nr:hypothetical protein PMAYCL1PPCAC_22981 [Pristionchus mayeri]
MSADPKDLDRQLATAKEEEQQQQDFEADAFLSLLRDDQILMGGFDLDQAIAETEGISRPASGDGAAAPGEMLVRLEMEGEDPVSDAEGDENDEEEEEWPPRDPKQKGGSSRGGAIAELTKSMMTRVQKMAKRAEEQAKGREAPSVTGTRLFTGVCFNPDEWSSEELKELYDGVKKHGTQKPALVRMLNHSEFMSKTRTIQDLYDKIADIRSMNKDHRAELIRLEKKDAHERGTLRFQEMGKLTFIWSQQMQKLQNSRAFTRKHEFVRDQLTKFFNDSFHSASGEIHMDGVTGGPPRPIRWTRLYRVIRFLFSSSYRVRTLPNRIGINAMEAGVLLLIINDISKQARANLTDRTRAENGSLFLALARQEYRRFNLDVPVEDYAKPFVDPLGMREWRSVEVEDEEPEEEEMTYDQMFPVEETSKAKGKKRHMNAEDLVGELETKRVPLMKD